MVNFVVQFKGSIYHQKDVRSKKDNSDEKNYQIDCIRRGSLSVAFMVENVPEMVIRVRAIVKLIKSCFDFENMFSPFMQKDLIQELLHNPIRK